MENNRLVKPIIFILGGTLFVSPFFMHAYSTGTHAALAQETIKLFNEKFQSLKISDKDAEFIIQGSIDEDSGIRWMHHFYDPVYNRGLVLEDKDIPDNPELALVAGGAKSQWTSSKEWAMKTELQGDARGFAAGIFKDYFSSDNDHSWDRAIYEYAWEDKKRGLETLGHILHLLQDATVPDHTRNDPHPPVLDLGSPYEYWTKKFNRNAINENTTSDPILFNSLPRYFDTLASYSNNNFFSKDTIQSPEYSRPSIDYYKYGFGFINENLFPIVHKLEKYDGTIEYTLIDRNNEILKGYWTLLSEQAILHGAGAMKLFFDEVEKERQTKTLYNKNRSWFGKRWDSVKSFFGTGKTLPAQNTTTEFASVVQALPETSSAPTPKPEISSAPPTSPAPATPAITAEELTQPISPQTEEESQPQNNGTPEAITDEPIVNEPPPAITLGEESEAADNPPLPIAISGGGGSSAGGGTGRNKPSNSATPPPPMIIEPEENTRFSTTTLLFRGRAEANSTITNSHASTTTATDNSESFGFWEMTLDSLPQGTTTITFHSVNAAGIASPAISRTVIIDTKGPTATLTIDECSSSLAASTCLVATTTLNISWNAGGEDADFYSITCTADNAPCPDFSFSKTTATSTVYSAPSSDAAYTFTAQAVDSSGNEGEKITKTVTVAPRPLVINEIAWMGTGSGGKAKHDEWVEIYNSTKETLTLAGIRLTSLTDNGGPDIALTGTLAPDAYYLIERTDDDAITDIAASTTASFGNGISNNGEVLALVKDGTIIDRTPEVTTCDGWCGGSGNPQYFTMERFRPNLPGTDKTNWGHWNGILKQGTNIDGNTINGTPGARNTLNHLIAQENAILTDTILTTAYSPYVIANNFTVQNNATLTIKPGVIIKFLNSGANFTTSNGGIISAVGTEENPIIFTSFKDDTYGGDTNRDGAASTPQAEDWGSIKLTADGSTLNHIIARYGGVRDKKVARWANFLVDDASFTLKNAILEYAGGYGAWLKNANGTVESVTVRHNTYAQGAGIRIFDGTLTIKNNTFLKNTIGISLRSEGDTHAIQIANNKFLDNTSYAIQAIGIFPTFSGNTASGNGVNGINIQGQLVEDHTATKDLPYIIQNTSYKIPTGKTLTIAAGAIFKLEGSGALFAEGKLITEGTADQKIVFTSLNDDDCGITGGCGNTNGTSTAPTSGDWRKIEFTADAASSSLTHTIIRYGGESATAPGALRIRDTSITLQNVTVEKNKYVGIWMQSSTSTSITSSTIQDHSDDTGTTHRGIRLTASSTPTITNTIFSNNEENISADSTSSYIDGGGNTGL